jgi:hypothetical protein
MLASELSRPEYGLYFRPHNDCIEFLFQILETKIYDHSPNDAKQKRRTYFSSTLNLFSHYRKQTIFQTRLPLKSIVTTYIRMY